MHVERMNYLDNIYPYTMPSSPLGHNKLFIFVLDFCYRHAHTFENMQWNVIKKSCSWNCCLFNKIRRYIVSAKHFLKKKLASPFFLSLLHATSSTSSVQPQRTTRYTLRKIQHSELYYQQSATMFKKKLWNSLFLKQPSYDKPYNKVYFQSKYWLFITKRIFHCTNK